MVEFLKKIGFPATVAAIVGALVTIIPIFFKLDERYAKEEKLTQEIAQVNKQINDLSIEVGKLAGSTQVLVSVMSAKNESPKAFEQPKILHSKPTTASIAKIIDTEPTNAGGSPVASIPIPEIFTQAPPPKPAASVPKIVYNDGYVGSPSAKLKKVSETLYGINQRVEQLQSNK
jgi:hypothetical protein